jgi:hypothetical protein
MAPIPGRCRRTSGIAISRTRPAKSDDQLALFIRDEQSGRLAFNAQALRALGVDPAEARDRGYSITNVDEFQPDLAA